MSKKSFIPSDCIGPLNTAKQGIQMTERPFSKESMLTTLKGCGLPTNSAFWSIFRNSGILQEVSKGKFMFASKEPIYIGMLIKIQNKYRELMRHYKNSSKSPRVPDTICEEDSPKDSTQTTVEEAIKLLKEQGYRIFAPIDIVYKEV